MKKKLNFAFLFGLVIILLSITFVSFYCFSNKANHSATLDVKEQESSLNEQVVELSSYLEEMGVDLSIFDEENLDMCENLSFTQATTGTFILDVVLINPCDKVVFTDALARDFVKRFNDNENDNYLSVHEYYYIMSRGAVNIWANVRLCQTDHDVAYYASQKSSNAIDEKKIWEEARYNGNPQLVSENYSLIGDKKCVILPCLRGSTSDLSWPHAYSVGIMMLPYNKADVPTLTHESLHMFGLLDLYTSGSKDVVSSFDIMCDTYSGNVSLSAFYRYNLGWISKSGYSDSSKTPIETISQDGTYTLNVNTSQTGVIAYEFGKRTMDIPLVGNMVGDLYAESFYIEYRRSSNTFDNYLYGGGLVVYRINESAQGNLNYEDSGLYSMYVFNNTGRTLNKTNGLVKPGKSIGSASKNGDLALCYSDGEKTGFVINNIVENADGTISFTIKSNDDAYESAKVPTMAEFKSGAMKGLMEFVSGISEIYINTWSIVIGKGFKVIGFTSFEIIKNKVVDFIEENEGIDKIKEGIDYIANGISSSSIVEQIASSSSVSKIKSVFGRIVDFFK